MPWTQAPLLRVGERVRLTPGGPVLVVYRVTSAAAYLRGGAVREVTITDNGEARIRRIMAAMTRARERGQDDRLQRLSAKLAAAHAAAAAGPVERTFEAEDSRPQPVSARAFVYREDA